MGKRGILRTVEGGKLLFWCPGCECAHGVNVGEGPGPRWGFNGDCTHALAGQTVALQPFDEA